MITPSAFLLNISSWMKCTAVFFSLLAIYVFLYFGFEDSGGWGVGIYLVVAGAILTTTSYRVDIDMLLHYHPVHAGTKEEDMNNGCDVDEGGIDMNEYRTTPSTVSGHQVCPSEQDCKRDTVV
jgi:hypothetical protein